MEAGEVFTSASKKGHAVTHKDAIESSRALEVFSINLNLKACVQCGPHSNLHTRSSALHIKCFLRDPAYVAEAFRRTLWRHCLHALCVLCLRAAVPGQVKHRVAQAADTQDRYLSGIRPVRFMAICSESVHPLAIME